MKKYILIAITLLFYFGATAQEYYYYYKGKKCSLTLNTRKINVTTTTKFSKEQINIPEIEVLSLEVSTRKDAMFGTINIDSTISDSQYDKIVSELKKNKNVIAVHPNYLTPQKQEIGMSSYLYVRLKKDNDIDLLKKLSEQKHVVIVERNKFLPLWYTLVCTENTPENTLNVANYFYETGLFASAVPDFLSNDATCTNDPEFSQLWGLNNVSYPNVDVNACDAWSIARGNGVTIAVLDEGIELTHVDLQSNISTISYDTESNTSPSNIWGSHGTHCAGIIGALRNNNTQVVGLAPECTLMSVSNSLMETENSRIKRADGINWAWKHGADVINNSWISPVQYDIIDEAIDSALTYGRNGKGTIIVFATGNNGNIVSYPANSNSGIIAVGAIEENGYRASFSNYGTELDVVAPGVSILSTIRYNNIFTFSGTSQAAPYVSALAGLLLSLNPNLTYKNVATIIESTAQKVGGYSYSINANRPNGTWNNLMGYGLIDAYAAVNFLYQCPTIYVQNQTITSDSTVFGCKINANNVIIQNNANVVWDAAETTTINGPFQVNTGSTLEIR